MPFETNHGRTKYCSDSCRVKAFYARQEVAKVVAKPQPPLKVKSQPAVAKEVKTDPALLYQNAGITAGVAALNYAFNDYPAQKQIISLLESIKQGQSKINGKDLFSALAYLVDYVGAQVQRDGLLGPDILKARKRRENSVVVGKKSKGLDSL
jgi:hypothetical protein